MRNSMRNAWRLVLSLAVVALMSAVFAGTASAYGSFVADGDVALSGSLTWELNGGSPVTCSYEYDSGSDGGFVPMSFSSWDCSDHDASTSGVLWAMPDSPSSAWMMNISGLVSPFETEEGDYVYVDGPVVDFVEGDVTTPSRLVFDDSVVGWIEGYSHLEVSLTGELEMTTATGGLVTIDY